MKPSKDLDANQASEDELIYGVDQGIPGGDSTALSIKKGSTLYTFVGDEAVAIIDVICTEKLKLLDEVIHQSTVNLKSSKAVAGWAEIRKKQLKAEL